MIEPQLIKDLAYAAGYRQTLKSSEILDISKKLANSYVDMVLDTPAEQVPAEEKQ